MPNFSSLAGLEVAEKFLWGGGGGGLHSHFHVTPNRCVVLCWGWGFDKKCSILVLKYHCLHLEYTGIYLIKHVAVDVTKS